MYPLELAVRKYVGREPMIVTGKTKTGIEILYDNPSDCFKAVYFAYIYFDILVLTISGNQRDLFAPFDAYFFTK